MNKKKKKIEGVYLIKPKIFKDERGYFFESFNQKEISKKTNVSFVQDNQSLSSKNIIRGLHFQKPPFAQDKLVTVIKGSVLDVVVDIRVNSKTYGKYIIVELNEENHHQLFIPIGMAHGFLSLEDHTIFSYKCSDFYNKESEGAIKWNDPDLNIKWPISNPILSEKDENAKKFSSFVSPFF
ncbi:MAG: dTDP-4-dehydrorhamnose 3,5-epimerase [Flavobacteriales bacterium]|nr:dTDP-4-dehydrorhamnose 3,5-epimerase [Flavobacteriales bacterium]